MVRKTAEYLLAVSLVAAPLALAAEGLSLFVTADRCMSCHNGLVTAAGEDASIGTDWRSSMMANAARDPYWQAAVRREMAVHPTAAAQIQHECAACHMPMTRFAAKIAGGRGEVFAHLPALAPATEADRLAVDGVSCSLCHQIRAEGLGEEASFTAGFEIDTGTPPGRREIFGPFEVDSGLQSLMRSASRFVPTQGEHVQGSELCATCHTLYTHALDDDGEVIGELPEQVPYLEWKHSAYFETRACQSCHMPEVDGELAVSGVLGTPRANVSRHVFRGGNFFMPRMLNRFRDDLGPQALSQELEATARQTAAHLSTGAARLRLESLGRVGDRLRVDVVIENLAGHKLPSAYPSRRAWIHFSVRDRRGTTLFESGRLEEDGSVAGNDNDADHGRFEPHHTTITDGDQVQMYEAILGAPDGSVTTVLLTAVRYLKDNRLLPQGFDKATAPPDVAVHGAADADADFIGGIDRARYEIDVSAAAGAIEIRAELWYQPVAFRWARNLAREEAPEIGRFVTAYDAMAGSSAVILARDSTTLE